MHTDGGPDHGNSPLPAGVDYEDACIAARERRWRPSRLCARGRSAPPPLRRARHRVGGFPGRPPPVLPFPCRLVPALSAHLSRGRDDRMGGTALRRRRLAGGPPSRVVNVLTQT